MWRSLIFFPSRPFITGETFLWFFRERERETERERERERERETNTLIFGSGLLVALCSSEFAGKKEKVVFLSSLSSSKLVCIYWLLFLVAADANCQKKKPEVWRRSREKKCFWNDCKTWFSLLFWQKRTCQKRVRSKACLVLRKEIGNRSQIQIPKCQYIFSVYPYHINITLVSEYYLRVRMISDH